MKGKPRAKRETTGIYLRGNTWWISYCGPRDEGGWGEIRESTKSPNRDAATKLRKRRLIEVSNDRDGIRKFQGPAAEKLTVGDLLDRLKSDYETRNMFDDSTASHIKRIRNFFGNRRAVTLTRTDIEKYIAEKRAEKKADATIDRGLSLLKRAFRLAQENGEIAFTPRIAKLVKGHENARSGFVDREALENLLAAISDSDFRDYLEWFSWTGMRPGETASLEWSSFDRETWTIRLQAASAKTGHLRVIPVEGPLRAIIERRIGARRLDCTLIFHYRNGRSFGGSDKALPESLYSMWRKAAASVGLPNLFMYDLRRTVARNLRAAGIPERVIMEITGHRTRAMFDRYGIVDQRDLKNAFEVQEKYIQSLPRESKVLAFAGRGSDTDRTN